MGRDVLVFFLYRPIQFMDTASEFVRGPCDEGHGNEDGDRERGVQHHHPREREGEGGDRIGRIHDGRTDEFAHRTDVVREVGEQRSRAAIMEEPLGLYLECGHEVVPQIFLDEAGHQDEGTSGRIHEDAAADCQQQDLGDEPPDVSGRRRRFQLVDRLTNDAWNRRGTYVRQRDEDETPDHLRPIPSEIGNEAAQLAQRRLFRLISHQATVTSLHR